MKKHNLILLLTPIVALASCTPAVNSVGSINPVTKAATKKVANIKTPTRPALPPLSTHGVAGQPC